MAIKIQGTEVISDQKKFTGSSIEVSGSSDAGEYKINGNVVISGNENISANDISANDGAFSGDVTITGAIRSSTDISVLTAGGTAQGMLMKQLYVGTTYSASATSAGYVDTLNGYKVRGTTLIDGNKDWSYHLYPSSGDQYYLGNSGDSRWKYVYAKTGRIETVETDECFIKPSGRLTFDNWDQGDDDWVMKRYGGALGTGNPDSNPLVLYNNTVDSNSTQGDHDFVLFGNQSGKVNLRLYDGNIYTGANNARILGGWKQSDSASSNGATVVINAPNDDQNDWVARCPDGMYMVGIQQGWDYSGDNNVHTNLLYCKKLKQA